MARILREHGRSQPRRRTPPAVRSLAAQQLTWPAFGLLRVRVKNLRDRAGYREPLPFGPPRYQLAARILPQGTIWLAFSAVNDSIYALLFADCLLVWAARCGVKLSELAVLPTLAASSGAPGTAATGSLPSRVSSCRSMAAARTVPTHPTVRLRAATSRPCAGFWTGSSASYSIFGLTCGHS